MQPAHRYFLSLACCLVLSAFSKMQKPGEYKLVWSDEFNYTGLPDSTKWTYDLGGDGWGNNEMEYYTANRKENARVEHGNLVVDARKEDMGGKQYTSARLLTKGKADWTYGRIEVRARLPRGKGTWPAIWMLGSKTPMQWPDDGEIDIMEHVGFDPGMIHASIHCKAYNHIIGTQKTAVITVADCMDSYHVYGMQWDAEHIEISVDGKKYFSFSNEHKDYASWPFSQPMHLLLNVAVGGNWGGQKGVDQSVFPQQMLVDYVRVYQRR